MQGDISCSTCKRVCWGTSYIGEDGKAVTWRVLKLFFFV